MQRPDRALLIKERRAHVYEMQAKAGRPLSRVLLKGFQRNANRLKDQGEFVDFGSDAGRCCVNRNWHRALPRVGSSPIDRERLWSTKLGHSIEHVARKHRFDSLRGVGALIQRGRRAVAGMLTIATAGGS